MSRVLVPANAIPAHCGDGDTGHTLSVGMEELARILKSRYTDGALDIVVYISLFRTSDPEAYPIVVGRRAINVNGEDLRGELDEDADERAVLATAREWYTTSHCGLT